eukprot:COSAG05_NODE_372_length_10695_cov_5.301623_1_plen_153_part_00
MTVRYAAPSLTFSVAPGRQTESRHGRHPGPHNRAKLRWALASGTGRRCNEVSTASSESHSRKRVRSGTGPLLTPATTDSWCASDPAFCSWWANASATARSNIRSGGKISRRISCDSRCPCDPTAYPQSCSRIGISVHRVSSPLQLAGFLGAG